MLTVALVGGEGLVGSLVAADLRQAGHEVVAIGAHASLASGLDGCHVLIDASGGAGASAAGASPALEAATRTGIDLIDVSPVQARLRAAHAASPRIVAAGARVVIGAGMQHVVGDTLAHLAAGGTRDAREIHVAYALPDRGSVLGDASAGRRRSAADELFGAAYGYVRGELVLEPIGEQRRLAWFPRPIGPAHAASIPAGEAVSVPLHVPGVDTVRTYVALSGWRSELLQFTGTLAGSRRFAQQLRARVQRPRSRGSVAARRRSIRWACVAEASGRDGVARAWAYGHDPYRLTAAAAVQCAEALSTGSIAPGVVPPARLRAPDRTLDDLAGRTDLRWSIIRPETVDDA